MNLTYYAGKHVYFRAIEKEDAAAIVAWRNDPESWRTLGKMNPLNRIREEEYIDALYKPGGDIVLGVSLFDGDRFIGMCGLHRIDAIARSANFGILIGGEQDRGHGFGIETTRLMVQYGFEELNLNRIELCVFGEHERGIHVYTQAGFVKEGVMREAYYRNGKYQDVIHMAVLRREWSAEQ
jgi:RimJ/RimL family protein N-acetyltransferase